MAQTSQKTTTKKTMRSSDQSGSRLNHPFKMARTLKEGYLCCKLVVIQNKRASDRSWRNSWVILRDSGCLYIYQASPNSLHLVPSPPIPPQATSATTPTYTDPLSGVPFPVVNRSSQCHVQLASDYKKRQRVFRLLTSEGCELLLQAPDAQNLCEWLFEIRRACGGHLLAPVVSGSRIDGCSADEHVYAADVPPPVTCCSLSPNSNSCSSGFRFSSLTATATTTKTSTTTSSSSASSSTSPKSKHGSPAALFGLKHLPTTKTDNLLIACTQTSSSDHDNNDHSNNNNNSDITTTTNHEPTNGKRLATSPLFLRRGVPACLRRSATVNNVELIRLMNPGNHLSAAGKAIVNSVVKKSAANHSSNSKQKNFGIALCDCEYVPMNPRVPVVVVLLSKLIESCGIKSVGIYRQTGSVQTSSWMVGQLNKGVRNADFTDARWNDTKAIASTLKCFFAKLPECLFSKVLYSELIKAAKINEHDLRLKTVKMLIRRLPQQSIDTLQYISRHFATVASMVYFNKVDVRNIAIIFGPTLLWHPDRTLQGNLADNPEKVRVIEMVVNYNSWLFNEMDSGKLSALDTLVPALCVTYTKTRRGPSFGPYECAPSLATRTDNENSVEEDTSNEDGRERCPAESGVEPMDVVHAVLGGGESDSETNEPVKKAASFVSNTSSM